MKKNKVIILIGAAILQLSLMGYWLYIWRMDQVINEGASPPSLLVLIGSTIAIWGGVLGYSMKKD